MGRGFGEVRRGHFQSRPARRCASSANAILPASCAPEFKIPFPKAFVASNRIEAEKILAEHPQPFVIKNPLCSPTSPIHTILCETVADTRAWLRHVNYAEGVFLQEYLGRAEAGHIALVSGGEIYSLVTNQEYKYAFNGNQGIVAGAPLGGLVERDENDKYGLARRIVASAAAVAAKGELPRPDPGDGNQMQARCRRALRSSRLADAGTRDACHATANGTSSNTTSASASRPAR